MRHTRIKICGVRSVADAQAAVDAGADALGFVLADGSTRTIPLDRAVSIARGVPPLIRCVGVFRNQPSSMIERWPFHTVQVHGRESEELIAACHTAGKSIIRGLAFDPEALTRWDRCDSIAALLVDSQTPGSGTAFDHDGLRDTMAGLTKPVILAGGLTPDNVEQAIRTIRPYAVDVSTGVESEPGMKNPERIVAFCEAVRRADGVA